MDIKPIKVTIADVSYPLRVSAEEEATVREAERLIEERIDDFRKRYEVFGGQQLLSMIALNFAVDLLEAGSATPEPLSDDRLRRINRLLDDALSR